MTQRLDKVPTPIHSAFNPVDVTCSCTKCDSNYCFAKRHDVGSCSCEKCSEPKTCLFYGNKTNKNHSDGTNTDPIFTVSSGTCTRRFLWNASTNTNNPSKNTLELYKSMLETSKIKIDALRNTYLSGTYTRDILKNGEPHSHLEEQNFERQRPAPSNYTTELSKSVLETLKIAVEPLKNIYLPSKKRNEIEKRGASNYISEISKSVLESQKIAVEPLKKIYLPSKNRDEIEKRGASNYISEISKSVLESQKIAVEPLKKIYLPSINRVGIEKRGASNYISELSKRVLKSQKIAIEPLKKIYLPSKKCDESSETTKIVQGLSKNKPETNTNRIDSPNLPSACCNCDGMSKNDHTVLRFCVNIIPNMAESKKKSKDANKFKYELCNNILEIQKNIMETLDSMYSPKEKPCDCEKIPKKKQDPGGYIYEVPKCTQEPMKSSESHENTFDTLDKTLEEYSCKCDDGSNNTSRSKSDSPGYVFERNKYNNKPMSINNITKKVNCKCYSDSKNTYPTQSDSPKYAFQVNKHKDKPIPKNDPQQLFNNTNGTFNKESCYCDDGPKKTFCKKFDSVGYVYELNKDKPISANNTTEKDNCNCDNGPINTFQPLLDSSGYVFELPKYKHDSIQKDKNCNCDVSVKNTHCKQIHSVGYIYELNKDKPIPTNKIEKSLNKYKQETVNGPQQSINKEGSFNRNYDTKNTIRRQSDSPGYIYDLNKYKQEATSTNDPLQTFIIEEDCNCNSMSMNNITIKGNCKCGTYPTQSDSPEYAFELNKHKYKPIPKNDPKQLFNNTNGTFNKESCYCDDGPKKTFCKKFDSVGYVYELNKDKPISANNTTEKDNCNCDDGPKKTFCKKFDSVGYVFELPKYKQDSIQKDKNCNCDVSAKNTHCKQIHSVGYIYELNKDKPIPTNKIEKSLNKYKQETVNGPQQSINKEGSFNCNYDTKDTIRRQSDSPGYIYDLNKYKQEATSTNDPLQTFIIGEDCNCNSMSMNNKTIKGNCKCGTYPTQSDSPEYAFELNKHKYKPIPKNDPKQLFNNTNGTFNKESCYCDDGPKKTFGKKFDSVKNTIRRQSDSPGYIYDLNKYKQEATSTNDPLQTFIIGEDCNCNSMSMNNITIKGNCKCGSDSKSTRQTPSDSPEYAFELNKHEDKPIHKNDQQQLLNNTNSIINKESCNCDDGPKKTFCKKFDSVGYVYELNKDKPTSTNNTTEKDNCNCDDGPKKTFCKKFDSVGYVYELNKDKPTSTNNTTEKDNCNCDNGPKNTFQPLLDSSGYVFELPKYKHDSIQKDNNCNCDVSAKNTSCKQIHLVGYIYELNKDKPIPTNKIEKSLNKYKQETVNRPQQSLNKEGSFNCNFGTKNTLHGQSDSPGYLYDLNKQEATSTNDPLQTFNKGDSCNCNSGTKNTSRRHSDSPGSIYELTKYKQETTPTNGQQPLNKGDSCYCNSGTKNTSRRHSNLPGYIYDLIKYKQGTTPMNDPLQSSNKEDSCNCNSSAKNTSQRHSDSPGYIYELTKSPTNGPQQSFNKGDSCYCNSGTNNESRRQSDSPGYIYEFTKYKQKPIPLDDSQKISNKEDSCSCKYGTKNISKRQSDSPEFEFNKFKPMVTKNYEKSCECYSNGYILRLDKYKKKPKSVNNREILVNRLETQNFTMMLNNTNQERKNFECNETLKSYTKLSVCVDDLPINADKYNSFRKKNCDCNETKSSKPAGYIFELHPNAYEPSQNTQELCKSIIETQVDAVQAINNMFKSPKNNIYGSNKSPGYPLEQNNLEVYNLRDTPEEIQSSCICPKSSQHSIKPDGTNNNIQNMNLQNMNHEPYHPGSQIISLEELKRIYLPKQSYEHRIETQAIQIGKLKEIYLPKKNKIESKDTLKESKKTHEMSKNTLDLCRAPTNKIQTLKNIYMPPKFTVDYSKKYEYPDVSNSRRNVDGNETLTEACCRKEIKPGTAMLSAEIMNMPYTKFNDSVAHKEPDGTNKTNKLTKYDILNRIIEAYNACSCKVCECIVGKPIETTVCNCQPCECNECTAYLDNSNHLKGDIKCPCARCNKAQCQKAALEINKLETCDCKPCDCIKCTKGSTNLCDCEPCQCDDCKQKTKRMLQTYVVAPVGVSNQRVTCSCSPCDCIECGQTYPLASSVMQEMSTGTNRHALCRCEVCLNETCDQSGVNACKCERRNRVMSKPVEKDSHDYDIRTATVMQYNPLHHHGKKINSKHDTIAMFAALPDKYATFACIHKRPSNTKSSNCKEQQSKEDAITAIKSSQLFSINKAKTTSNLNINTKSKLNSPMSCECEPCDCQIRRKYTDDNLFVNNQATNEKSCVCVICDCLDCNGEHKHHKYSTFDLCKCKCRYCKATMTKDPHRIVSECRCIVCKSKHCFGGEAARNTTLHRIKKGEVLSSSTHQVRVNSMIMKKQHLRVPSSLIRKMSPYKDNTNTLSKNYYRDILYNFDKTNPNKSKILKGDTYIQCQEQYKGKSLSLFNKNSIHREISGSNFSGYSSFETSPKTSDHKGCGSITPMSRKKNKSWESSCNSSGYDNPQYLIQFPKSTVESCLQDVMALEIDKTIKLDGFNIIPNSNCTTKHNVSKEKLHQTHKCNLIDSNDSKFISINQTGSIINKIRNNFNQRNYKDQTNEEKSVMEIKDKKQPQGSDFSLRSHTEKSNYINEFHPARQVYDYNVAEENGTLFPIHNERYCTWSSPKQLPHPYFVNAIDILNIDEDSKRVQKTLKEAKEFSLELTRLLEMYEKANKEFQSISEKPKMPHILNEDYDVIKESCSIEEDIVGKCFVEQKRFNEIEHELQEIHLEAPSVREKLTYTSILQDKGKTKRTLVNGKNNINLQKLSTYKDVLNYQKVREPKAEYDPSSKMNSVFDNNLLEQIETHLKNNEAYFESVANEQVIENCEDIFQNDKRRMKIGYKSEEEGNFYDKNGEIVTSTNNREIKRKGQINTKNYKKYSKLLKRTIIISKRICIKHSNRNESIPVDKYCVTVGTSTTFVSEINTKMNDERNTLLPVKLSVKDTKEEYGTQKYRKHELNQIRKKLHTVFGNIEDVSVCSSTDTYGLDKDLDQYGLEDKGIDNNLELKETPQISLHKIHRDVKNVDKEVWCTHTCESLEDQIRNLLDLSVSLTKKDKELDDNVQTSTLIPSIGGEKSSCESLKVSFLGVRRVSDHTVLVKWNVPQVLTNVKGYELLVDGRAVQKIFSPSMCMAVVTCLPHTDKMLLTIRTIISSESMTGHYPATTIIYRPRVK